MKMMTFFARVAWAKHEADRVKANVNVVSFDRIVMNLLLAQAQLSFRASSASSCAGLMSRK
jgi:hypothetical protein